MSPDWRDELLARVQAVRAELHAIIAYYETLAYHWHLENERQARDRAA